MKRFIAVGKGMRTSAAATYLGLTPRALRFYEERGLIELRRDVNNARYFDPVALDRLEWIARLREARVPLRDIREVFEADDRAQAALEKLEKTRRCAVARLQAVELVLSAMREVSSSAPAGAEELSATGTRHVSQR